MKATLEALVKEHGLAAVLAGLRDLAAAEADELAELDEQDTAAKVDAIAGAILRAARDYDALTR